MGAHVERTLGTPLLAHNAPDPRGGAPAKVANAPCTYGAFEITIGIVPGVPEPDEMLAAMAAAGYAGTELGPVGYLGPGEQLRARLAGHGLELAGGFVPLRLSQPRFHEDDLAMLAASLDAFA